MLTTRPGMCKSSFSVSVCPVNADLLLPPNSVLPTARASHKGPCTSTEAKPKLSTLHCDELLHGNGVPGAASGGTKHTLPTEHLKDTQTAEEITRIFPWVCCSILPPPCAVANAVAGREHAKAVSVCAAKCRILSQPCFSPCHWPLCSLSIRTSLHHPQAHPLHGGSPFPDPPMHHQWTWSC